MISAKNLTKRYTSPVKEPGWRGFLQNVVARKYKETIALDSVAFEIGQGELIGLIGPNGAGKTTTMKILSGILYPTSGDVSVLGYIPFEKKYEFLRQIAFLMGQRNQLLWDLPAVDSFNLNKAIYEISDEAYKNTIDELTSLLNATHLIDQPVKTLSLGERMKMELIASLLHSPKVLFLDEPTIGLDVVAQQTIRNFIKEYQKRHNATIVLTSHYMEDVKELAKRVLIINQGKIIYDGDLVNVVNKYAKDKVLSVLVGEIPDKKILEKISDRFTIQKEERRVIFTVPKKELSQTVEKVSKYLKFSDITIEEEKIEDVIRKIFTFHEK